jgi:hypothetical protein
LAKAGTIFPRKAKCSSGVRLRFRAISSNRATTTLAFSEYTVMRQSMNDQGSTGL